MLRLPALARLHHRRALAATVLAVAVAVPVTASPALASGTPVPATAAPAATASDGAVALASMRSAAKAKPHGAKPKKKKVPAYRVPSRILKVARTYDGSYYRHGGSTPAGFDCSGYTRYVFSKLGRHLPHNAAAQYTVVHHVKRGHVRRGDLIFFRSSGGHIYHVGIYAGHGHLYHASEPGRRTGIGVIFSWHVSFGRA